MIRRALCLFVAVCLCGPARSQADSGMQAGQTAAMADSSRSAMTDSVSLSSAPADVAQPAGEPGSAPQAAEEDREGYSIFWIAGAALLGILIGAIGYRLASKKENAMTDTMDSGAAASGGTDAPRSLQRENEELQARNASLLTENEQLKQEKAELERHLHSANVGPEASDNGAPKEVLFYMPQPNMNGRFQEASRRDDAAEALYVFRVQAAEPEVASFEFIAKDAYLNAAIGNEPSWIAIACDRSNQPSVSTTRVRTDVPGVAYLQDGEWAIARKAKITYL